MERLIKILKSAPISAYKINALRNESKELYFVLDKLETSRTIDTRKYSVTVYKDIEGRRGSANFVYFPHMSEEELVKTVEKSIYAASLALNAFYEIPAKSEEKPAIIHSNFENMDFEEVVEGVAKAVFEADKKDGVYLSATEIYVTKLTKRIVNSNGVDETSFSYKIFIEAIPVYGKEADDEVETYHSFTFSKFDPDDVREKIADALRLTKARYDAIPLKLEKPVKVILEGEGVPATLGFFVEDLSYSAKYMRMNLFEIGEDMHGEKVEGDRISVKLLNDYPGISSSASIDDDGVILKPITVIENGKAVARHGDYRFGYYLGERKPTGRLPIVEVKAGSKPYEEMRKEPYLRCVKYSSFQTDKSSGYFGGEVRLGFYFDGEKEIPVTGFSIAGSLHKLKGSLVLSKEVDVEEFDVGLNASGYVGPKYIEIKGMDIL